MSGKLVVTHIAAAYRQTHRHVSTHPTMLFHNRKGIELALLGR
jgi:hypothetical protein